MDQVKYNSSSVRGPSALLWKGFDFSAIRNDPSLGMHRFTDFEDLPTVLAPGADVDTGFGPYSVFLSGTTNGNSNIANGVDIETTRALSAVGMCTLGLSGTTVDNEAGIVFLDGAALILDSSAKLAAFEARIKVSSIADSLSGIFCGLLEVGANLSATNPMADAGTLTTTNNWLGFHRLEGDGDKLDIVYNVDSGTQQNVSTDAVTLVADTWIKVGFRLDKDHENTKRITFYVDGVAYTSAYITSTNIAAATFPSDVGLCPVFAWKAASTTGTTASCDWMRVAQVF